MKTVPAVLTGIFAGILTGWLAGRPDNPEHSGRAKHSGAVPPPAERPSLTKPAAEEIEIPAKRPGSVRDRIRFEQSLLQLTAEGSRRVLPASKTRGAAVDDFAAVLLGWRAAENDTAAALEAAGDAPACAGVLRRWLLTDAAAALEACGTGGDRIRIALDQYAGIDPVKCAAEMLRRKSSAGVEGLLHAWAARDPHGARAWAETHYPKLLSDFYRGWILADAPAAVAAVSSCAWSGDQWAPPSDWMANAFSMLRSGNLEFAVESFRKLDPGQLLRPSSPATHILSGIADWDIEAALHLARGLKPAKLRDTALAECAKEIYDADVPAALELANSIETPRLRIWALSNIAHALGETDPYAADPVMESLTPLQQYTVADNLLDDFRISAPALAEKWEARCRNIPLRGPGDEE